LEKLTLRNQEVPGRQKELNQRKEISGENAYQAFDEAVQEGNVLERLRKNGCLIRN